MNSERTLTDLLNIKYDIEKSYLKKTVFLNKTLESHFKKYLDKNSFKNNLVSIIIVKSSYLITLIFLLIAFFHIINVLITATIFSISLIILIKSKCSKNTKFQYINDNAQIFLSNLNLNLNSIITSVYLNTENNDNEIELLRIIMYQSISTNIYIITKLEANLFTSIFYMFLNFIVILISILFCKKNHNFHYEIVINFCIFLIFYLSRKAWDIKLRILFAEKYKFETLYLYSCDYLNGLNGFTLSIKNNYNVFCNEKINNLIENIILDKNEKDLDKTDKNKLENDLKNDENKNYESMDLKKKMTNEIVNYHKSEDKVVIFLKNLVLIDKYEDRNAHEFKKESNNLLDDEYSKCNFFLLFA